MVSHKIMFDACMGTFSALQECMFLSNHLSSIGFGEQIEVQYCLSVYFQFLCNTRNEKLAGNFW